MRTPWITGGSSTHFPRLPESGLETEVAIVGGGIAGLTLALLLKWEGYRVVVLESQRIAQGETGHTTAHLTAVQDVRFKTLARKFGKDGARLIAEGGMAAITQIERIADTFAIDCDLQRVPAYLYTERKREVSGLRAELAAAREAGLACELVSKVPLPFETRAGIRFDDQARFHPRKYLVPIAFGIDGDGSYVFENTHVREIKDGRPCTLQTSGGWVRAQTVIAATDAITTTRFLMQTRLAPYRTYALALSTPGPLDGLFYDTADPYHYLRTHPADGGHLLIVGGADHRVGARMDTGRPYRELEGYVRERFGELPLVHRWSGQVLEPMDGLPYVGRSALSRNVYVATGFSGNGMVNGTLAAMTLAEHLMGREVPWARLLRATRIKPLASLRRFVTENVEFPRHLLTDRLPRRLRSAREVSAGEGRIVSHRGQQVAVYRSPEGEVHALSPVCPHLGCHVSWNQEASTWDCPCHGSRFGCTGEVLHGPAMRGLSAVPPPDGLERLDERPSDEDEPHPSHPGP